MRPAAARSASARSVRSQREVEVACGRSGRRPPSPRRSGGAGRGRARSRPGAGRSASRMSSSMRASGITRGAEALGVDRHGLRDADRVGDLHLAAVREAGGDDVLGDVACRVGGRAVDLRRILARERPAAVRRRAAVGVDDDLAAREAGVAHRAADRRSCRSGSRRRSRGPRGACRPSRWPWSPCRIGSITCSIRSGLIVDSTSTPSRCWVEIEHALDLDRRAMAVLVELVAHRDLRLAVGPQVVERAVLAHLGEPAGEAVGEHDRQRHQLLGLVDRVAEHHALVACAGLVEWIAGAALLPPRTTRRRPARCRATARRASR